MDLPNFTAIKKLKEKLKIIEMDLEESVIKNDIKHISRELDKFEKELGKIKSFIVS